LKKLTTKPKTDPIPAGQGDELTKKKEKNLIEQHLSSP
jgi:hypothetical protein